MIHGSPKLFYIKQCSLGKKKNLKKQTNEKNQPPKKDLSKLRVGEKKSEEEKK